MTEQIARPDMMEALEELGYRNTGPRRHIIALLEGKRTGFTVEQIYAELSNVGRATIFRTVKILLEAGVICKVTTADGAPQYSLSRIEHHHHHTVCVQCGQVGEFRAATLERMMRALSADIPGALVGHRLDLYITCPDCLEQGGASPEPPGHAHAHRHAY